MPVFLYTDIEGSTQLWEHHGQAMGAVLDRHDEILMNCVEGCGGRHVKNTGDGMMAVFDDVALDYDGKARPLECALAMQRRLAADLHTREKATADLEAFQDRVGQTEFETLVARGRSLTLTNIRESKPGAGTE